MTKLAHLPDRAVIEIAGEDRVEFLQGLVSNDVAQAAPGRAVWAALLTPQGKYLADFFIFSDGERLLLDCARTQAEMLVQKLSRFRLRARAALSPRADYAVYAAWGGEPDLSGNALAAPDPRLPEAGWRILATTELASTADADAYDTHRLVLGLPDGPRDMEAEKSVLLEGGFDELNGVSWTKGCYLGQELTARTRYRGLIKRRLIPVRVQGALPANGSPVLAQEREVGTMRSGQQGRGLALLRIDALDQPLTSGGAVLSPEVPSWMRMPQPAG